MTAPAGAAGQPRPRFLPWLRTGLAGRLGTAAVRGLAPADTATLTVEVRLRSSGPAGEVVDRVPSPPVRLRAPGEIVGLDSGLVVRCDPPAGTQDAESNYFPLVEFTAPDLPWRFTPAAPALDQLQPWLALVVVEERDGVALTAAGGGRLPVLTVDDAGRELPDLDQCWAWAHVQALHDLADGVPAALGSEPAAFRSRLLCPRRLLPDRPWLACVVPTFESGRRAGLGQTVGAGLGPAWDTAAGGEVTLPVYYSWRFRTGRQGDFESLVRRLTPRELGPDVGLRDLDVSAPGGGLPAVPGTVLSYQGALVSPAARPRRWPPEHRAATATALRRTLNRDGHGPAATPDPYDALVDDPVVGPAAYGAAQAHRGRVPAEDAPPVWFGQLNTEPVHRAVAGLGAEVVRRDQEVLMGVAWADAAALRDVNRTLGRGRLAWEAAVRAVPRIAALPDESLIQIAGPALARLPHPAGVTGRGAVAASALPSGLLTGAFRRATGTVRGFVASAGQAGAERSVTRAVTSSVLADPVGFVGSWADVLPPAGADLHDPEAPRGPTPAPAARARARRRRSAGLLAGHDYVLDQPATRDDLIVHHTGSTAITDDLVGAVRAALDPPGTIVRMVEARVTGLTADRTQAVPAGLAARPEFSTPMYERLRSLSADCLVPGLGTVPDDTLGLLEVNRPFVEAFLAGLNTEIGREFRWREYPAQLDATCFRQFWDPGATSEATDILPIRSWSAADPLGGNLPPKTPAAALVLLVKGALPRRYPDLRVYAVEAMWSNGTRREDPDGNVRLPVFAGLLGDSAFFYGFTLTEQEARGSTRPSAHPGYFLVLEQQPRGARFGLDVARDRFRGTAPGRWSSLSWAHLAGADDPLPTFVDVTGPAWLASTGELPGNGGPDAWGEDAAAMARITLQRPVRMLVHADSMLPAPPAGPG